MLKDFKEFALKGNVMDLAVGVVIGGAFGKIVTSFVNDVITPLLSPLVGRTGDLKELFISMDGKHYATMAAAKEAGVATLNYGLFVSTVIDFMIIAFSIFIVIRQLSRFKKKTPPSEPTTRDCPYCLTKIPLKAVRCPHCTSNLD